MSHFIDERADVGSDEEEEEEEDYDSETGEVRKKKNGARPQVHDSSDDDEEDEDEEEAQKVRDALGFFSCFFPPLECALTCSRRSARVSSSMRMMMKTKMFEKPDVALAGSVLASTERQRRPWTKTTSNSLESPLRAQIPMRTRYDKHVVVSLTTYAEHVLVAQIQAP
jgi:hypothetical protein